MLRVLSAMLLAFTLLLPALPAQAATAVVTVNGQPITDVQVAQRLALYKIEGKSNRTAALNELINEALQVQEAERLGYTVSESEIDDAVLDVARQIKVSASNLSKILTDNGVPMSTLRDRLKANIAENPAMPMGEIVASAPPASMTSASPRCISRSASPNAWALEEQALVWARLGP